MGEVKTKNREERSHVSNGTEGKFPCKLQFFFFLSKSRQKDHKFVFVCIYLESSFYIYNILT